LWPENISPAEKMFSSVYFWRSGFTQCNIEHLNCKLAAQGQKGVRSKDLMNHLSSSQLLDYARGLLEDGDRAEIESHLAGCEECGASVAFLSRVWESAQTLVVPAGLVEAAKALILEPEPQWAPLLHRVVARLVPRGPGVQSAEVRSVQPPAHHFMYRWNDYCLDLRLDREPESAAVSLLGQIANQRTPDAPVGGVPVTLTAGERVIAETRCNSLGEFLIEFVPVRGMRVRFDVREADVSIDVPLSKLKV
jgi:hypothetical protein